MATPTILVKKSDGTFVRMSLDEIKAQKNKAMPRPQPQPLPPKKVSADFAASLSENISPPANPGPRVSASRIDQVDAVIKKLSFSAPTRNLNRLRTIIQLRLKDVRSVEQTKDSLLRPELDGGMALTARQAEEVLQKCEPPRPSAAEKAEVVRPLKPVPVPAPVPRPVRQTPPTVKREELPATSTPNNAFVHGQLRSTPPAIAPVRPIRPIAAQPTPAAVEKFAPAFKLSSAAAPKPVMHDVVGKPMEMTPVDEVRYFSLTDFRRLAADPAAAAEHLKQKFSNLKDESIVLYLQGLTAWRNSPLYLEYLDTVLGALGSGQKLLAPRDRKLMQFNELTAIVAMEQTMEYL